MAWRLALAVLFLAGCSPDYEMNKAADGTSPQADTDGPVATGDGDGVPDDADPGGVKGRICSPNDAIWVADASVTTTLPSGKEASTTTDADGWFTLEGLPPGDYTVHVEKGKFSTDFDVTVSEGQVTDLATEECLSGDDLNIAVVSGDYDSIQKVLDKIGVKYTLIDGQSGHAHVDLLRSPAKMAKYDMIFFNCGMNDNWVAYQDEIGQNVRDYVNGGGSVYVSDWSYYLAEVAYPDMVDFIGDDTREGAAYVGETGTVKATVKDPAMIKVLGSDQAKINYNLPEWAAPNKIGTGKTLIHGSYEYMKDWDYATQDGPLAARLQDGDGQIVYTSFHNEAQTTLDMDKLLEEIILSL